MADKASLENLIEGLAGAIVEAQDRVEQRQLKIFRSFFDGDNHPRKFDVLVPSLRPGITDDVRYRVPLLPLVAGSLLRIKEVEISFDTDIVGIADEAAEEGPPKTAAQGAGEEETGPKKLRSINLDIRGAGVFRKKTGTAHVVIKVEGRDISEGMARVVDRLLQVQGEIGEGGSSDTNKPPQQPQNKGE